MDREELQLQRENAEEILRCDLVDVLSRPAGRRVFRWLFDALRPQVVAGNEVSVHGRAALTDACNALEERLFELAPEEWANSLREGLDERLSFFRRK